MSLLPQWTESFLLSSMALAETGMTWIPFLQRFSSLFTTLRRRLLGLEQVTEQKRDTPHDFIVFISIHYAGWKTYPTRRSMQLNAVKNDVKVWLDYLNYRHDREDHWRFHFLLDFDLAYEDASGKSGLLPHARRPTRSAILKTLEEATRKGGLGFIYYGGHSHFAAPGNSEIEHQTGCIVYKETMARRRGTEATFLISCDGKRIYGKEFYTALGNQSTRFPTSSTTLILDTCSAEAFIEDFGSLPFVYGAESVPIIPNTSSLSSPPLGQLIVVAASRKNEMAGTFGNCGALSFFLTGYLQRNPNASAAEVVRYLDAKCQGQPDQSKRQHPQIRARYALNGPLRL